MKRINLIRITTPTFTFFVGLGSGTVLGWALHVLYGPFVQIGLGWIDGW